MEMRMFVGLFGDGGVVLAVEEVCKWSGLLGAVQMVRPLGCKWSGLLGEGDSLGAGFSWTGLFRGGFSWTGLFRGG